MLKIPTRYLLLVNGLLWTAIGIRIALIGVEYYGRLETIPWWYFLLSVAVFAGFFKMFTGVVRKYAASRSSVSRRFRTPSSPGSTAAWDPACFRPASASSSAGGKPVRKWFMEHWLKRREGILYRDSLLQTKA